MNMCYGISIDIFVPFFLVFLVIYLLLLVLLLGGGLFWVVVSRIVFQLAFEKMALFLSNIGYVNFISNI